MITLAGPRVLKAQVSSLAGHHTHKLAKGIRPKGRSQITVTSTLIIRCSLLCNVLHGKLKS